MAANPNLFIYYKRGEFFPFIMGTSGTLKLNTFSRNELLPGMINKLKFSTPIQDINTGQWQSSQLYSGINELYPNDSTFIRSKTFPTTGDICEIKLSGLSTPESYNNHTVSYRYSVSGTVSNMNLIVSLYQGNTLISSKTELVNSTGFQYGFLYVTSGEASNITDYSNLRIRLNASGT